MPFAMTQAHISPTAASHDSPQPMTQHLRATLFLGLPLIGSHVAQFALHVVDTIMLGWYGVLPLAAGVLSASSFFVVFVLGSGFAKAVMPMVASARAQGDERQVRRVTRMALWLSIAFGMVTYPLFWWADHVLLFLGQQPEVAALGRDFLHIAGFGMVPALLVMVLKSYMAALGRTQVVLWVTLIAVPVNVAMGWAFIFGNWGAPELGVQGAALSTLVVQLLSLAILLAYAAWLPDLRRYQLFIRFWRPDWQALRAVFRLGWPMGFTGLAEVGMFQASALMMGWMGTLQLAAHGIAMEITAMSFMVHVGLSNAVTVRTGYFHGTNNWVELRRAALAGITLSLAFALLTVAVYLGFGTQLISIFIDPAEPMRPDIIRIGVVLLACAALFQFADASQAIALGMLGGVQDTRVPMVYASISYWGIGIPASYLMAFPMGLGPVGLWLGLSLGLACAAISLMLRFWRRKPPLAV